MNDSNVTGIFDHIGEDGLLSKKGGEAASLAFQRGLTSFASIWAGEARDARQRGDAEAFRQKMISSFERIASKEPESVATFLADEIEAAIKIAGLWPWSETGITRS